MIPLLDAKRIADGVVSELAPHCERIAIAGSIRRQRPEVGDIEIVAIPSPYDVGLFESGIATVVNRWEKVRGELPCRYTQRVLPEGVNLDLFFATPVNWGLILAIRTGSARFSHEVLAAGWVKAGFNSVDGGLVSRLTGDPVPTPEETDVFHVAGLQWVEPQHREWTPWP